MKLRIISRDPVPWPKTVDANWQIDPVASGDRFRLFLKKGEIQVYPNGDWSVFFKPISRLAFPQCHGRESSVDDAAERAVRVYFAFIAPVNGTAFDLREEEDK